MKSKTICVDLDGSLILTDSLHELFFEAIKTHFFIAFKMFFWWATKGRAYCKQQLTNTVDLTQIIFPPNKPLLSWLEDQKSAHHMLYLVTGANQKVADAAAKQFGIFDGAFGSDDTTNLVGEKKAVFLNSQFGEKNYLYVGNSHADFKVFSHAAEGVVVNNKKSFIEKAKKCTDVIAVFKGSEDSFYCMLRNRLKRLF